MYVNLTPQHTMDWLYHSLVQEHAPLKEFDIIKTWQEKQWLPKACLKQPLSLFRTHFFIFHQLYTLKARLLTDAEGDLDIHTLDTKFIKAASQDTAAPTTTELHQIDGLLHYYLDWRPFFLTNEREVDQLLRFAHAGIKQPYRLQAAFQRFEINPPLSEKAIKKAYRRLATKHHPDKGGDLEQIQTINEDKSLLMQWLQYQQV